MPPPAGASRPRAEGIDARNILTSKRSTTASARVLDSENIGDLQVDSHRTAHEAQVEAAATSTVTADLLPEASSPNKPSPTPALSSSTPKEKSLERSGKRSAETADLSGSGSDTSEDDIGPLIHKGVRLREDGAPIANATIVLDSDDEAVVQQRQKDAKKKKKKKKKVKHAKNDDPKDRDGFYLDVNVQPLEDPPSEKKHSRTADCDAFFEPVCLRADPKDVSVTKRMRKCIRCSAKKSEDLAKYLVMDVTTLRGHLQADHYAQYHKWCKKEGFQSKLRIDVEKRKETEAAKRKGLSQSVLDGHLREQPVVERVLPYTDDIFREVAIEWLIMTEQPIQAFRHPSYQRMIEVAARATNGVKIPSRKATRAHILGMFQRELNRLKDHLASPAATGEVNSTCDGWQAHTVDGYLAVTAHWISELVRGTWVLESALIGFTRLNNAHNGVRLGQALFKIFERLGIVHKIGRVTCDNAKNNDTTMDELGRLIEAATGKSWNGRSRRIRCMAHVINLATQAIISTQSKSKFYDPYQPNEELADSRDSTGLIRAIAVKERSSATRKDLFHKLQEKAEPPLRPVQLLIDMPVRWSSTYVMLFRAQSRQKVVDEFITEIAGKESNMAKRMKLYNMGLSSTEWDENDVFLDILTRADLAQQAFSSDGNTTLHLALPALETLHRGWKKQRTKLKYFNFRDSLQAGLEKIEEYYNKTAESQATLEAYILTMVLDPAQKLKDIKKYWNNAKQCEVDLEKIFAARWTTLNGDEATRSISKTVKPTGAGKKLTKLLVRELSDDDSDTDNIVADGGNAVSSSADVRGDAEKPWTREYRQYLDSYEVLPDNMTLVQYWGINYQRYPTWGSLARDVLPIQASSVSSERAFSAAGITISKRRNRLKADIVEALQFIKCSLRKDLLRREEQPTSALEQELEGGGEEDDEGDEEDKSSTSGITSWYDDLVEHDDADFEGPATTM